MTHPLLPKISFNPDKVSWLSIKSSKDVFETLVKLGVNPRSIDYERNNFLSISTNMRSNNDMFTTSFELEEFPDGIIKEDHYNITSLFKKHYMSNHSKKVIAFAKSLSEI